MRFYSLLLVLFAFSVVNGLSVNIDGVSVSDDYLSVDYSIILNQPEFTNYSLLLFNNRYSFVLLDESGNFSLISDSLNYPLSSIPAGVYNLSLRVVNPSINITEFYSSNVVIKGLFDYNLIVPDKFFVGRSNSVIIDNLGNTDLSVSLFFRRALGDIIVSPQSFLLPAHQSRVVSVKPVSGVFNSSLIIELFGSEDVTRVFNVSIVEPIVIVNYSFNKSSNGNFTIIDFLINNSGNIVVNGSISARGFSLSNGFVINQSSVVLPVGVSVHSLVLPKSVVTSVGLSYDGVNGSISDNRSLSFLDRIPFNFKLTRDRLLLLLLVSLLLFFYLFIKFNRHRRP